MRDGRMRALNLELKIEFFDLPTSPVPEDNLTYPNSINAFTVFTINLSTLHFESLPLADPLFNPI